MSRRPGTVYFAQPTNGGPIRIGFTGDPVMRQQVLGIWVPSGMEFPATVRGSRFRESFLHSAFAPIALGRDWFRSCAAIWRAIIEAQQAGDLAWVDAERPSGKELETLVAQTWKWRKDAAAELGVNVVSLASACLRDFGGSPTVGKIMFQRRLKEGRLPDYISALHSVPESAAQTSQVSA